MKKTPDVSIVVLNYNTSDLLDAALESIQSTVDSLSVSVVVIDNASTDGGISASTKKFVQDSRFDFIQNEKNVGLAAMNIMLSETKGKYILTMDPDARLLSGALRALINFLEATPEAGAATANLLNADGTEQRYFRRLITPSLGFFTTVMGRFIDKYFLGLRQFKKYHYEDADLTKIVEIEQPSVSCLLIRRAVIGEYIIDPDTPFYFTDVGLCKRIYNQGYKIYLVPDAKVIHLKSTSFKKTRNAWRTQEYYRSLMMYFKKEYPNYAPTMWFILWGDRLLRDLMLSIMDREPMR
ncbi:MAG TPA: glycosyltransferase family 2 protein [Candidatus Paceibacterota bacterium]|nr:glycosyltransferase family 2 protein [Candidatus Paceibacterota bacterium]